MSRLKRQAEGTGDVNTPEEVKQILDESIREALNKGYELVVGSWGDLERSCCALSSLVPAGLVDTLRAQDIDLFAEALGCSIDQCYSLAQGFDGVGIDYDGFHTPDETFYEVGQWLRRKYIDGPGTDVQS